MIFLGPLVCTALCSMKCALDYTTDNYSDCLWIAGWFYVDAILVHSKFWVARTEWVMCVKLGKMRSCESSSPPAWLYYDSRNSVRDQQSAFNKSLRQWWWFFFFTSS